RPFLKQRRRRCADFADETAAGGPLIEKDMHRIAGAKDRSDYDYLRIDPQSEGSSPTAAGNTQSKNSQLIARILTHAIGRPRWLHDEFHIDFGHAIQPPHRVL